MATSTYSFSEARKNEGDTEIAFRSKCSLKALNSIAKRPPVNIVFNEIGYTVRSHRRESKILHDVSGEFRSGELTCILGPSGAGKSTLLHILSGYTNNGVEGVVKVNGHVRDMSLFKKLICYIMHDDFLQPRLTVLESMQIAAELKLGTVLKKEDKILIVTEILQTLGLWMHRHTMCERLSGGESKRLAIALELINNPPVIFLDEPTTGLDIVSVRQLIILLQLLSRQGRTIISTIHQPAASLFELFDNTYIVCEGRCCYLGTPSLLVPFLAEVQYICPPSHNPADFVIETLTGEIEAMNLMSDLCQNGKICRKANCTSSPIGWTQIPNADSDRGHVHNVNIKEVNQEAVHKLDFSTSFSTQFLILIRRMYIQSKRNKMNWILQFTQFLICGSMIGGIFFMVGNEGSTPMANFKFYISVLVFMVYTPTMIPILLFPTEIRIMRREYFNRWYGLKAYYAALTCSKVPTTMFFGMFFIIITFVLSGQLFEWHRFILFALTGILINFCSEGLGLVIGSILNTTNGAILGPSLISPLLVLSCYGMGFGNYIEPSMKALMSLSYLRYGLTGLTLPMYQNRTIMHCSEDICIYAQPSLILQELGMANETYYKQIVALIIFTVLHRTLAYFVLRHRLTLEYSNKFLLRISKFLKY